MRKKYRKLKKRIKRRIEKNIRKAYRSEQYVSLVWDIPEAPDDRAYLFRVFYKGEDKQKKNRAINTIANNIVEDFQFQKHRPEAPIVDEMRFVFTKDFPARSDWISSWEPYEVMRAIIDGIDPDRPQGKPYYKIQKEMDRMYGKASSTRLSDTELKDVLFELMNDFDALSFSWMRAFWYKPWHWKVAHEQDLTYLPAFNL